MLLAWKKNLTRFFRLSTRVPKSHCLRTHYHPKRVAFFSGKKEKGNPSIKTVVSRERLLFSSLPGGLGSGGNFGKTAERERDAREPKKERGE